MIKLFDSFVSLLEKIVAIFFSRQKNDAKPKKKKTPPPAEASTPMLAPKWYKLALSEIGTKEIPGEEDNPAIVAMFADAGFPGVKDDETAWCAGAQNSWLVRSGQPGTKSLAARSFMQWGKPLTKPRVGCIVVFWRGSPNGWQGHVGMYVREDEKYIYVLGGNQRNSVNISRYSKSRLLGYRWPVTLNNSRTMRLGALGMANLSSGLVLESFVKMGNEIKMLGSYNEHLPVIGVGLICVGILCKMGMMYARWDDRQEKGR